jgi:hypothetical protein
MRKHGIMSEEQWKGLSKMRSNKDNYPPDLVEVDSKLLLRDALEHAGGYDEFPKEFPMAPVLRTNCFSLSAPSYDTLGTALDLVIATTNHSCEPNAYAIMDGPKISLRTLRPISKDEEIFINYVDVTEPFAMRRVELRSMYFFDCTCTKCKRGPTEREDQFLRAPNESERALFRELPPPADDLEAAKNHLGSDDDSKLLAITQAAFRSCADLAITDVPSPTEKLFNLHTMQRTWSMIKLWPQHRYPWPKIHNDLLLATLDLDNWFPALLFSAKIYLDIDPILYPQEHAPLRVVHTWRLVMLLILCGDGNEPTLKSLPLDHDILICALLDDLILQVPKSHGADSRFYKMVKKKHDEITTPFAGEHRAILDTMVAEKIDGARKQLRKVVDSHLDNRGENPPGSYLRDCLDYLKAEATMPMESRYL